MTDTERHGVPVTRCNGCSEPVYSGDLAYLINDGTYCTACVADSLYVVDAADFADFSEEAVSYSDV
ncbi:MAG: hypothetical protein MJ096_01530 [Clostridia bacterium]|nr:hypothetical protein [Clostridia bacterium]